MTATTLNAGDAATRSRRFYVWMAAACVAVAFLGFAPTYWVRIANFHAPPIIHIHGLLFSSWTLFLLWQSWQVSRGEVLNHRAWGLLGISLATAMCIVGVLAAIASMAKAAALGAAQAGREFSIVPLSGIVFFGVVVAIAIANVQRPETHKRLMLLATVSILQAAVARWFFVLLAPPAARHLSPSETPPGSVVLTIAPGLLVDLLIVAAMVFDWRTRGKVHPVYLIGGAAMLAMQFARLPLSTSPAWLAVADWIARLAS